MNLTCYRSDLLAALALAASAASKRGTATDNALFELQDGKLSIDATDLDVYCKTSAKAIDAQGIGEQFMVSAGRLRALIADGWTETVSIEAHDNVVKVFSASGGKSSVFTVLGVDPATYSVMPKAEDGMQGVIIPLSTFRSAIAATEPSVAKVAIKYALTGFSFEILPGSLEIATTDTHRLTIISVPIEEEHFERAIVAQARCVTLAARHLAGDAVTVYVGHNHIVFASGGVIIAAPAIQGRFPKYRDIIPRNNQYKLTFDRAELSNAVRQARNMSDGRDKVVKLEARFGEATISASAEYGDAKISIGCEQEGELVSLAFAADYLFESIGVFRGEKICLQIGDNNAPVLIQDDQITHVLMPVSTGEKK